MTSVPGQELFPYTESARARLRPGTAEDGPGFYELMLRVGLGAIPNKNHFLNTLKVAFDAFFVVVNKEKGEVIGYTALADLDQAGHVRFLICAEQGADSLALEATWLTINYAFSVWAVRKVYVHVTDSNNEILGPEITPVVRLEATLPEHEFFLGKFWEVRVLAIYRDDWLRTGKLLADQIGRPDKALRRAVDDD